MTRTPILTLIITAALLVCGCQSKTETTEQLALQEEGKAIFKKAIKVGAQNKLWESLALWDQAITIYDQIEDEDQNQFKYMLYRNRAAYLNKVQLHETSVKSMEKAIEYLNKSKVLPKGYEYDKEYISSLRYKATYLREYRDFERSNKIFFDILSKKEVVKGLHAQIKNLIGKNYLDLNDPESAFYQFDDILKITDLKENMKAHYLQNRAKAAYKMGKTIQAFVDMSESVSINERLGRPIYTFAARMDLGELYMLENDFEKANEHFDLSLKTFDAVHQDPDLFKIHNLKYTTSTVLGLSNSKDHKLLYDSLNQKHRDLTKRYSAGQELALLESKISAFNYNQSNEAEEARDLTMWLVFGGISILLSVFFYFKYSAFKKSRRQSVENLLSQL